MACTVRCACICFYAQVHAFQVSLICAQLFSLSFVLSAAHFMFLNNSTPICVSSYSHSHGCACKRACVCLYVQMFAHESHCASVLCVPHSRSWYFATSCKHELDTTFFTLNSLCVKCIFRLVSMGCYTMCIFSTMMAKTSGPLIHSYAYRIHSTVVQREKFASQNLPSAQTQTRSIRSCICLKFTV